MELERVAEVCLATSVLYKHIGTPNWSCIIRFDFWKFVFYGWPFCELDCLLQIGVRVELGERHINFGHIVIDLHRVGKLPAWDKDYSRIGFACVDVWADCVVRCYTASVLDWVHTMDFAVGLPFVPAAIFRKTGVQKSPIFEMSLAEGTTLSCFDGATSDQMQ